jgi:hypothetical protein
METRNILHYPPRHLETGKVGENVQENNKYSASGTKPIQVFSVSELQISYGCDK